jgi:hypothetical protein
MSISENKISCVVGNKFLFYKNLDNKETFCVNLNSIENINDDYSGNCRIVICYNQNGNKLYKSLFFENSTQRDLAYEEIGQRLVKL